MYTKVVGKVWWITYKIEIKVDFKSELFLFCDTKVDKNENIFTIIERAAWLRLLKRMPIGSIYCSMN